MLTVDHITWGLDLAKIVIWGKLPGACHPVSKSEVEERGPHTSAEHGLGQPLIIRRRHFVWVVKWCFLDEVNDPESHCTDWEQDGDTETEHEGYKHWVKNRRVLEVHKICGSCSNVDVSLDRGRLGLVLFESTASVHQAVGQAHAVIHEEFQKWIVSVENHRRNERVSCDSEPVGVEVWNRTL